MLITSRSACKYSKGTDKQFMRSERRQSQSHKWPLTIHNESSGATRRISHIVSENWYEERPNHTTPGDHGAAVRCTRCKITSPVLDVGLVVIASHLHLSTHCTEIVSWVESLDSVRVDLSFAHESSPGSKYSGSNSEGFSEVCVPSQEKSTFTVVLSNGSQVTPGIVQSPQNLGRYRLRLLHGPNFKVTGALKRWVALHSWPLWNRQQQTWLRMF